MGQLLSLAYHRQFVIEECWVCHVTFAITAETKEDFKADGTTFYCPRGCRLSYGEGTIQQLERALADAQRQVGAEAQRAETNYRAREKAEKSLRSLKRRTAAGVCPVVGCKRTCQDIARHIKSKHPDYRTAVLDGKSK